MERMISKNKRKYSELQNYIQTSSTSLNCIFTQVEEYPSFFNENLVDSDRTIKLFHHQPYTHQTIFYFQLLKLIYETQQNDFEKYLVKIYDLIDNPDFEMQSPPKGHQYYVDLNGSKMKRMIQQFLQELGQSKYGVSQLLAKYPIMDKVLVIFMRTILVLGQVCQNFNQMVQSVDIYQFLADYFEVDVTYYTNCIKFNLTDIFVYFEAASEVYLAFITPQQSSKYLPSSQEYYQSEPQQAFNISSVRQMVSEIDIAAEEECFDISKPENTIIQATQYLEYDYSQSQQCRRPSRSIQQSSQVKLSNLVGGQDSILQSLTAIKSNKALEKQIVSQKKSIFKPQVNKQKCFQILEVPMELQNAFSPLATPRGGSYVERTDEQNKLNNYYYKDCLKDHITFADTGQSQEGFKNTKPVRRTENKWETIKQEADMLFMENESQSKAKTQKNLKSLYEMRSIKTIISCNDSQSCFVDTPSVRSNFHPSFSSFQPSFQPSRKVTNQCLFPQMPIKKNGYTKYGYVNNNISNEFTNSILLKQMGQPFKGHIAGVKTRARKERTRIQNMINF